MTTEDHMRTSRVSIRVRELGEPGSVPGHFEVDADAPKPEMEIIAYSPTEMIEVRIHDVAEIGRYLHKWPVTWINVNGLGDANVIRQIGELFSLHPLALEDVVHVHQRAKVENYGEHEFIVARMATREQDLEIEQVSIFLGRDFVLTFQEKPGDCLGPLRERIRQGRGRMRNAGADYLAYSVLDGVVDNFFPVLEDYADRLERLEDEVLENPSHALLVEVGNIRHDLFALRRAVLPLREALSLLYRDARQMFRPDTRPYLRDCLDHCMQILDSLETYRQVSSSLMDTYLSSSSNRMNKAMHVLTVIGTIFLPLTFITSLYGMNFNTETSPFNMPELNWYYGYPACVALMAIIGIGLLVYFRQHR